MPTTRPSSNQNQPATQSRLGDACEYLFDTYQKLFVAVLLVAGLAIMYFASVAAGEAFEEYLPNLHIGSAIGGNLLLAFGLWLAVSAAVASSGKRAIPFSGGIEQPPEQREPGLLPVLCAAAAEHMRMLFDLPAASIASTISNHRFIQPPQPVRGGIAHPCLTAKLLSTPPAQPRN